MNVLGKICKKQRILIILGMFLAFYLAGCASVTEFPIGRFDCVECEDTVIESSDDGTLVVYSGGEKWFTGKWYVEGNTYHVGDSFCSDKEAMPASYKWKFDGEILTLKVIKDECADRVGSLDGKPWKLIEEK